MVKRHPRAGRSEATPAVLISRAVQQPALDAVVRVTKPAAVWLITCDPNHRYLAMGSVAHP